MRLVASSTKCERSERILRDTSASLLSGLRKHPDDRRYEHCWERFIDKYTPVIYGWCRRVGLNHQDTEEVTQQLMCRLVSALRNYQYDEQQKFRSWLFICTRNVIFQFWKNQATYRHDSGSDLNQICQSQSLIEFLNDQYDREFEFEARHRVQHSVKPRDWNIFIELTQTQKSASEIANAHQLTVDNVYKVKSRIVAALRAEIAKLQAQGIDS